MTAKDDVIYAIDRPLVDLIRRYVRSKYRKRQDDVDDLVHDVVLRLMNVADRRKISAPYACVVAKNLIIDRSRSEALRDLHSSRREFDGNVHDLLPPVDPERALLGHEKVGELLAALDQLGERTREVFILYRMDGMSQREIASRFDISVSAVEKAIARAVAHLAMKVDLG